MASDRVSRRTILRALSYAAGAAAGAGGAIWRPRWAKAQDKKPSFLIVLPAFGGGAIIDSYLPIRESESANPSTLDCFPDDQVIDIPGSPIRAANAVISSLVGNPVAPFTVDLAQFANKHKNDMMVTTLTGTSVNHAIGQKRAITGGGIWNGRTMQEMVALAHGEGYPLPNVNMASIGYLEPGADDSLPGYAYGEVIPDPLLKPLSLSADIGINDTPDPELIELARTMRDDTLDPQSSFYQAFRLSEKLKLWKEQRAAMGQIEENELINKLIFVADQPNVPLGEYGLIASEDAALLQQVFPDILGGDPLEQQAALAYLLIKNHVSVAVTISPSLAPVLGGPWAVKTPPLAFDGAHNDHRSAQAIMWHRVVSIADRLIDLLKATPFDPESGETFWDRTMIHFATDFGRDKTRPGGANVWGTAHNLNNGHLTISPMVNGNTVLGGVDPDTGMTYGFDLESGAPVPGRNTSEEESFAGILQAIGVDTTEAGLVDVPAMRKA